MVLAVAAGEPARQRPEMVIQRCCHSDVPGSRPVGPNGPFKRVWTLPPCRQTVCGPTTPEASVLATGEAFHAERGDAALLDLHGGFGLSGKGALDLGQRRAQQLQVR
jgi:hypothetical protein